jgi:hypothetical protein
MTLTPSCMTTSVETVDYSPSASKYRLGLSESQVLLPLQTIFASSEPVKAVPTKQPSSVCIDMDLVQSILKGKRTAQQ